MIERLFDVSLWIAGPAIIAILCLFAGGGLWVVRRRVLPRLNVSSGDSEFTSAMLQSVMVFYGLAVALLTLVETHHSPIGADNFCAPPLEFSE